jgi:hypothetical protein
VLDVSAFSRIRLWLVLGGDPEPELDELLAGHIDRRVSLQDVADTRRELPTGHGGSNPVGGCLSSSRSLRDAERTAIADQRAWSAGRNGSPAWTGTVGTPSAPRVQLPAHCPPSSSRRREDAVTGALPAPRRSRWPSPRHLSTPSPTTPPAPEVVERLALDGCEC